MSSEQEESEVIVGSNKSLLQKVTDRVKGFHAKITGREALATLADSRQASLEAVQVAFPEMGAVRRLRYRDRKARSNLSVEQINASDAAIAAEELGLDRQRAQEILHEIQRREGNNEPLPVDWRDDDPFLTQYPSGIAGKKLGIDPYALEIIKQEMDKTVTGSFSPDRGLQSAIAMRLVIEKNVSLEKAASIARDYIEARQKEQGTYISSEDLRALVHELLDAVPPEKRDENYNKAKEKLDAIEARSHTPEVLHDGEESDDALIGVEKELQEYIMNNMNDDGSPTPRDTASSVLQNLSQKRSEEMGIPYEEARDWYLENSKRAMQAEQTKTKSSS